MKPIGKLFIKGMVAVLPLALTIYILYWMGATAESALGGLIRYLISETYYVPGMGVAAGFLLILCAGVLLQMWLFRRVFHWTETLLEKLPLVKSVYGSIRDLLSFVDSSKKKDFDKVVMVRVGDTDTRLIGVVTRQDFEGLPEGIGDEASVAVYLPMSYQLGGFTVIVAKSQIQPVDMTIEEGMRFALTAAVSTQKTQKDASS